MDRDLKWVTLWNSHTNVVAVHVYEVDESHNRTVIGSIIEMEGQRYTSSEVTRLLTELEPDVREVVERRIDERITEAHESRKHEL